MYIGADDYRPYPDVATETQIMLQDYTEIASNVEIEILEGAGHSMVTNFYGDECYYVRKPYISNCEFDLAYQSMNFMHGDLKNSFFYEKDNFYKYEQPTATGINATGYMYVPDKC